MVPVFGWRRHRTAFAASKACRPQVTAVAIRYCGPATARGSLFPGVDFGFNNWNGVNNSDYRIQRATANILDRFALAAPTNLTATVASSSEVDLAWTENSSTETGFILERSPNALIPAR